MPMFKVWRKPAKPRAVLSVGFFASDFDIVNKAAEVQNVSTSAFVREVALKAAKRVIKKQNGMG